MSNFLSENPLLFTFILVCFLAGFAAFINQVWIVFRYSFLIVKGSFNKISERQWGEKYHSKLNEESYNFMGFLMHLWYCLLLFLIPPIWTWVVYMYFFLAFMSSGLLACSMIKRKIDSIDFEKAHFGQNDTNDSEIIVRFFLWIGVPYAIYIIAWFMVTSIYKI